MDVSTTTKTSRAEQCRKNAQAKSERKRRAAIAALAALQQEKHAITKAAVARQAGVSVVFLRKHQDLLQAIEDAEQRQPATRSTTSHIDQARDQVIAALQRRLDDLKQRLTATETALREKQRECDRLYGKLAAASPLTDSELRRALTEALERLRRAEEQYAHR
jgi:hypothetical protein